MNLADEKNTKPAKSSNKEEYNSVFESNNNELKEDKKNFIYFEETKVAPEFNNY